MGRGRFGLLVGAAAVIVAGGLGVALHGATDTTAATPITGLHVSGNQILNGAGQAVRPLGVDRAGPGTPTAATASPP
jgi:hypothetical protein